MTVRLHHKTASARTGGGPTAAPDKRDVDPGQVLGSLPRQRPVPGDDGPEVPGRRWVARPIVARLVQLVVLAVPIAASVTVALVLSAVLPHSTHLGTALLWWVVVVAGSTLTLFAVDRVARRLLPLAVLLRLSLLFPDQAPRRFRLAAQAWSSRRLREKVELARIAGQSDAPIEAAAQIIGLLASLSVHDRRTRGHCERVRAYNDLLADELGLSLGDRDRLRWAALIHDIGKLKVSPRLLNKPGAPTRDEWAVLRAHPLRGAEIAAPLAQWLGPWSAAIEQHHERWDGAGYPHGLQGTDISLGGRIVAVADAFEVMTSTRPYSRPVDAAKARVELAECAGSHFDPIVVRAFLNISLGRLRKVMGPVAWVAQVPFLAGMPRLEAAIISGGRQAATNAGAAGAAAGVVAVTTLAPVQAHGHHHVTAVTPAAESVHDRSPAGHAVDPPAGTTLPAPVQVATKHHGAAAKAGKTTKTTKANAGVSRKGSHHPTAAGREGTAPATGRSHADPVAGSHLPSKHEDASGAAGADHGSADAAPGHSDDPLATLLGTLLGVPGNNGHGPAGHGRCAGNHGGGLGNGGPADGSAAHHPSVANGPAADAAGLEACD